VLSSLRLAPGDTPPLSVIYWRVMGKDFDGWNSKKKHLNDHAVAPFYHKREIWWCSLGVNVGFEQDGTGANYDRPVLVVQGFNPHVFFGVALTGKKKQGRYYVPIGQVEGREASAILSQVRLIDTKRLVRKAGTLDRDLFERVCDELKQILFGSGRE
jgi:mRNA interferase MazF